MKAGPARYVAVMKNLLIVLLFIAIVTAFPILIVGLNSAGAQKAVYIAVAIAILVAYLVFYGFYQLNVSMGTVLGIEVTTKVVHIVTKRKTFTYDVKSGCVALKQKKNKFVGTFETQDSRDKFIFYRRAPFTKFSEEAFTEEDIRTFYPQIDETNAI